MIFFGEYSNYINLSHVFPGSDVSLFVSLQTGKTDFNFTDPTTRFSRALLTGPTETFGRGELPSLLDIVDIVDSWLAE